MKIKQAEYSHGISYIQTLSPAIILQNKTLFFFCKWTEQFKRTIYIKRQGLFPLKVIQIKISRRLNVYKPAVCWNQIQDRFVYIYPFSLLSLKWVIDCLFYTTNTKYHPMGKFSRRQIDDIFIIFSRKQDLTLRANCLLDNLHEMSNPIF